MNAHLKCYKSYAFNNLPLSHSLMCSITWLKGATHRSTIINFNNTTKSLLACFSQSSLWSLLSWNQCLLFHPFCFHFFLIYNVENFSRNNLNVLTLCYHSFNLPWYLKQIFFNFIHCGRPFPFIQIIWNIEILVSSLNSVFQILIFLIIPNTSWTFFIDLCYALHSDVGSSCHNLVLSYV